MMGAGICSLRHRLTQRLPGRKRPLSKWPAKLSPARAPLDECVSTAWERKSLETNTTSNERKLWHPAFSDFTLKIVEELQGPPFGSM
jgi:hypothetical protein